METNKGTTLHRSSHPLDLFLDNTNERVYILDNFETVFSISYDGKDKNVITNSSLNEYLFGAFGNWIYFQKRNLLHELNVSSGLVTRRIALNKTDYYDLVVVNSSFQPIGE